MYTTILFVDFEKNYINKPDGYLSVWFSFINPNEGDDVKSDRIILQMDMVYPSRLTDNKKQFIKVEISTKEEYEKTKKYLRKTQQLLSESLDQNFESGEEVIAEVDLV